MTWDDPGDPTSGYQYRLRDVTGTWTDWVPIEDPETTLRAGEGVTIEWTLTDFSPDAVYYQIEIRVSNASGHATAPQLLSMLSRTGIPITDPRNGFVKPRIQVDAALDVVIPEPSYSTVLFHRNPPDADRQARTGLPVRALARMR